MKYTVHLITCHSFQFSFQAKRENQMDKPNPMSSPSAHPILREVLRDCVSALPPEQGSLLILRMDTITNRIVQEGCFGGLIIFDTPARSPASANIIPLTLALLSTLGHTRNSWMCVCQNRGCKEG